ncbi:hypothetical protein X471_00738 [Bartonella bacilliformis str. Heidi Mejia]|nr:hypothetical protein X472_00738 [Bartonella bacilliformis San Pedro600-02]EYS91663.1 hypothetical protein X471_00738 [Bartonella bacilliformis str. Heidi Mejia]EYS94097.1 hypothetical protein X470_01158 [Bartonella bacilliformis Peru-18]KEG17167.1 hypothetical protein H705_00217 [Bartonella bacilliformis Cond044]KEG18176.1 hypothetical protein H709_00216 [Bartonella bacilliformis CUSCO5]KEG19341.1 hypothetical protein H707_00212 [Bartonella bacilliformis Hosp800-02]KEG21456.1 hypothetical 
MRPSVSKSDEIDENKGVGEFLFPGCMIAF